MTATSQGKRYEAAIRLILRENEALDSPFLRYAPRGTIFDLVSEGDLPRRVKVRELNGGEGWASLSKESGEELLRPLADETPDDATDEDALSSTLERGDEGDTDTSADTDATVTECDDHGHHQEGTHAPSTRELRALSLAEGWSHGGRPAKAIELDGEELEGARGELLPLTREAPRASVGEHYETTTTVLMRLSESLLSSSVGHIMPGIVLEILQVGEGRRVRVRVCQDDRAEGWVSLTRPSGEPLLRLYEGTVAEATSLSCSAAQALQRPAVRLICKSSASGSVVCDKCDGPHTTDQCPNFKGGRDEHKDAWVNYGKGGELHSMGGSGGSFTLTSARVVRQPGDGSCLFHSLNYGLGSSGSASASQLREEIASFLLRSANMEIAGDTLEEWVRYDGNASMSSYATRMSSGGWGGGIEMAACSRLKGVNIHVYESAPSGFKRISCFDSEKAARTIHVLYQGRMHYDALCPT